MDGVDQKRLLEMLSREEQNRIMKRGTNCDCDVSAMIVDRQHIEWT